MLHKLDKQLIKQIKKGQFTETSLNVELKNCGEKLLIDLIAVLIENDSITRVNVVINDVKSLEGVERVLNRYPLDIIKSLSLKNCVLPSDYSLNNFVKFLSREGIFEEFTLNNTTYTNHQFDSIIKSLTAKKTLVSLAIIDCTIPKELTQEIGKLMNTSPLFKRLILSGVTVHTLSFLDNVTNTQLTCLNLSNAQFDYYETPHLGSYLKKLSFIEIFDISYNRQRSANQTAPNMALLYEGLQDKPLHTLNVSGNNHVGTDIDMLCQLLSSCKTLQSLNLRQCHLTDNDLYSLMRVIIKNRNLPLITLNLSGNEFSPKALKYLESIKTSKPELTIVLTQEEEPTIRIGFSMQTTNSDLIFNSVKKVGKRAVVEYFPEGLDYINGGPSVLDHDTEIQKLVDIFFSRYNGLIIPGNTLHINPAFFKSTEKDTINLDTLNDRRTKLELALVKEAFKRAIPVLGICGGHQVISIALGGKLDYSEKLIKNTIPKEMNEVAQRMMSHNPELGLIIVYPNTALHTVMRTKDQDNETPLYLDEVSMHAQAVDPKDIHPIITICAIDQQMIVKAIEIVGHPHIVGTQFHPERKPDDPHNINIFQHFIYTCEETKKQIALRKSSRYELYLHSLKKELFSKRWETKSDKGVSSLFTDPIPEDIRNLKSILSQGYNDKQKETLLEIQEILHQLCVKECSKQWSKAISELLVRFKDPLDQLVEEIKMQKSHQV